MGKKSVEARLKEPLTAEKTNKSKASRTALTGMAAGEAAPEKVKQSPEKKSK